MTTFGAGDAPAAGAPGWFPDPWGTEKLRWWDGRAWTPHLYPPAETAQPGRPNGAAAGVGSDDGRAHAAAGVLGPGPLAAERAGAHWARLSLLWAGPLQAAYDVGVAVQAGWYADHFDELSRGHTPKLTGAAASVAPLLTYCSLGVLVAGIIFVVWFFRAATVARLLGLPARRSPGLAACSFLIPIVNLWWPYQSACDLLPPGHPGRHVVGRWWAAWIAATLAWPVLFATGWGPVWVRGAVAAGAVLVTLTAAAEARVVVATIDDALSALVEHAAR